ncbi:uncharacterized protein LOC125185370 isoform X2 [Salvia hispanica]|uniref:uncharacterized protein LOC125185370 isoform X2 n=1 Tax=Salvia hispanica TaxID=49212 RepID=UPI002008F9FD|nr:uncharacterized protein LOC125185370 isoform X2 [Salvia hispanica]
MSETDEQTRALQELCSMLTDILRSPPPLRLSLIPRLSQPKISPAAFGLLFIGISVALMLFSFVAFVVGITLMPLVITLMFFFYFVEILSNLSRISRAIFWPAPHSYNFVSVWNYSR